MSADEPTTPRLYVSAVEGHLVPRYGTRAEIGAEIIPGPKGGKQTIRWNTGTVVALSQDELVKYKREYKRAIKAGALVERTVEDFRAYIAAENAENERIAAEREAERKAVEEAETPPAPDDAVAKIDAAVRAAASDDDKAEG